MTIKDKIIEILENSFQFTTPNDGEYPANQILKLFEKKVSDIEVSPNSTWTGTTYTPETTTQIYERS
jgi:hypothetical protein